MRAFSKTESLSLALRVCLMLFLGSAVRFVHAGAPPVGAYQMSPALKAQIMAHNAAFKLRVERQQNAIMQGMRDAQDAIEIHLDPPPSDSGVHSALNEYLKQMGYVSIPLQRSAQGNQLYVKGSIGKNKQLFLVSTVSPITMVDRKFAQSAKSLGELNAEIDDEVLGHLADEKLLLIPQMVVGGVSFVNQPAAGSQLQLPTINRELDLGCVLGCDFFLRNNCLLDCYAGRLYARVGKLPANSQIDLNETLRKGGYRENVIQTKPGPRLALNMSVKGQDIQLLINSASSFTRLDNSVADLAGLSYIYTNILGKSSGADAVAKEYRVTMPELIRIGDVVVDGLPLVVGALGNFPGEKGLLGADLMGECQALIDFRNHRMWLRPPEVKK